MGIPEDNSLSLTLQRSEYQGCDLRNSHVGPIPPPQEKAADNSIFQALGTRYSRCRRQGRLFSPLLINTLSKTKAFFSIQAENLPPVPRITGVTSLASAFIPHVVQSQPVLSQVEEKGSGRSSTPHSPPSLPPLVHYSPVCAFQYSNRRTFRSTGEEKEPRI